MILAIGVGLLGLALIFFGIWKIHEMKNKGTAKMGPQFFRLQEYRKKRWLYTLPSMLGLVFLWGAAAATVPVVALSSLKVPSVEPGRMEVTVVINKQRNCMVDSLTVSLDFESGRREITLIDYPPWRYPIEGPLKPDVLETVINKNDDSPVTKISFSAKYTCPFGFHLDAFLGDLAPPPLFNRTPHD